MIPDKNYDLFSQFSNITYSIKSIDSPLGLERLITFNGVKSGYMLQPTCDKNSPTVNIYSADSDHKLYINFDQYFTGYRSNITFYMKYSHSDELYVVNDTDLVYHYESYARQGKYEFSSVQEDDRKQKGLIYLINNTYLYIDCQSILYIKISDATEVIKRDIHNIPLKITKVQYLKDTITRKYRKNTSLGTLAVKYSMNGYEEMIMLCDVNLSESPDCYSPTTKTVGTIVDLFIYKSQLKQGKCYLIIGSVSKSSMFSIISVFEDYRKEDQGHERDLLMFKFYGKITATVLGVQKFLLDAMNVFDRYLIFSNEDSLFVTNLEKFIESPQYFSPTQMKQIELNPLISSYSGKVFTDTE